MNINGSAIDAVPGSALEILNSFYRAFNQQDMKLMQANWLKSDVASMSNPLGDVKRGWPAICSVYEKIFHGTAEVYVEFYDVSIDENDTMFCAVGRERGRFQMNDQQIELAIRTSRIYQKHDGIWQQLHHHGSIESPELLHRYQSAVLHQSVNNETPRSEPC